MKNASSAALRRRRQQLVRALPPLEQIIRGSLIETYKRCGRSSCHCNNGPGHGPKRYLSTVGRTGDRARLGYVPNATYPQVARFFGQLPQNYRRCSTRSVGLLLCGICGERLTVRYTRNGGLCAIHECNSRSREGLPPRHSCRCQQGHWMIPSLSVCQLSSRLTLAAPRYSNGSENQIARGFRTEARLANVFRLGPNSTRIH